VARRLLFNSRAEGRLDITHTLLDAGAASTTHNTDNAYSGATGAPGAAAAWLDSYITTSKAVRRTVTVTTQEREACMQKQKGPLPLILHGVMHVL
jgi:hypothetical protein